MGPNQTPMSNGRPRNGDKTYQASKHFHKKMDDVEHVIRDVILKKLKLNVVPKKFNW